MEALGWQECRPVRDQWKVNIAHTQRKHNHAWFARHVGGSLSPYAQPSAHGRRRESGDSFQYWNVHSSRINASSRVRKITDPSEHSCKSLWLYRAASSARLTTACLCRCTEYNEFNRSESRIAIQRICVNACIKGTIRRQIDDCVGSDGRNRNCNAPSLVLPTVHCRAQPRHPKHAVQCSLVTSTQHRLERIGRSFAPHQYRRFRLFLLARHEGSRMSVMASSSSTHCRCQRQSALWFRRGTRFRRLSFAGTHAPLRCAVHAGLRSSSYGNFDVTVQLGADPYGAVGLEGGFADRSRPRRPRLICRYEVLPRWPSASTAALYSVFPSPTSVVIDRFHSLLT